jgi:hypothetical protein
MALTTFLYCVPSYAYLDPGTGSILLQGLLGGIAAGFVVIKIYFHRFLRFFGLRKDLEEKDDV